MFKQCLKPLGAHMQWDEFTYEVKLLYQCSLQLAELYTVWRRPASSYLLRAVIADLKVNLSAHSVFSFYL